MITQGLADSLAGLLFPRKLWILANSQDVESIKWGKLGTTVLINSVLIEKECFKPNVFNVQSNQHVLRQMSYYNFQKIDRKCKIWEFKHEHFQAGREDLLYLVKRQPQGVPKKYVEDMERRYSSRLQRRSMKGDRPNYARMEKGDSEGESEKDAQLFERRPSTRSTTKKRPYHRRIIKFEAGETFQGTRGRGARRGGRGRKRSMMRFEEQDESIPGGEEECNTKDRLVIDLEQRKELEYVVPNAENWLYGSLQNGMDGLTIDAQDDDAQDGATKVPGAEESNMQFGMSMEVPEDDKSHLKFVIERAMDAKRQQESMLANDWTGQPNYGTRMQESQNFSWSSPDLCHMDGRYPIVPEGNDSEMYSNGSTYPFFNPQSNFNSGTPCIPYGGVNLPRSMMTYDLPLPVPIQYSSAGNSFSAKMQSCSESLPPFSEFTGGEGIQDNIPRTIEVLDGVFRPQDRHRAQQKSGPVDCVTLDHNYNTVKGAFNTLEALEAELNPIDKTIQSVMQHHDSLLAQLIDEQNAERSLMNELRSRSSGESLEEPAPNPISPHETNDSYQMTGQQISTPQKSSEYHTSSSGSLDYPTPANNWTGDLIPNDELTKSSIDEVQNGRHGLTPSKADEFDATTVAFFLLDSLKYKKYSFTVIEPGDILIRDCVDDINYWRTKKEVNPQTIITSPCL